MSDTASTAYFSQLMTANNALSGAQSVTHKDYINNMLLQRFTKKYLANKKGQLDF